MMDMEVRDSKRRRLHWSADDERQLSEICDQMWAETGHKDKEAIATIAAELLPERSVEDIVAKLDKGIRQDVSEGINAFLRDYLTAITLESKLSLICAQNRIAENDDEDEEQGHFIVNTILGHMTPQSWNFVGHINVRVSFVVVCALSAAWHICEHHHTCPGQAPLR